MTFAPQKKWEEIFASASSLAVKKGKGKLGKKKCTNFLSATIRMAAPLCFDSVDLYLGYVYLLGHNHKVQKDCKRNVNEIT